MSWSFLESSLVDGPDVHFTNLESSSVDDLDLQFWSCPRLTTWIFEWRLVPSWLEDGLIWWHLQIWSCTQMMAHLLWPGMMITLQGDLPWRPGLSLPRWPFTKTANTKVDDTDENFWSCPQFISISSVVTWCENNLKNDTDLHTGDVRGYWPRCLYR